MVHPLLPDPRETALRVADAQLSRTWVGKSAKARARERDRLAAELLPLCEAVAEGLSPVAEAMTGLDGHGGITGKLRQVYEQDMARRAETQARMERLQGGVPGGGNRHEGGQRWQ